MLLKRPGLVGEVVIRDLLGEQEHLLCNLPEVTLTLQPPHFHSCGLTRGFDEAAPTVQAVSCQRFAITLINLLV